MQPVRALRTGSPTWRRRLPPLLTVAVTGAALGVGSLVLQRWVAQTIQVAIGLVIAWYLLVLVGALIALRGRPVLRRVAVATFGAVVVASVGVGYWTGFRETVVDEDVVLAAGEARGAEREIALAGSAGRPAAGVRRASMAAAPGPRTLAEGDVVGVDGHDGKGVAEVVQAAGGQRVLTLTRLDVDPGPDVDVLLSASGQDVDDAIDLGDLKGSKGDQQYEIPADADLRRYRHVVLYCNPFTVRIAVAELDG